MVVPLPRTSLISSARKHCANWNDGDCLGCMMKVADKSIIFRVSGRFAGFPCQVCDKCDYFDRIVVPGIKNEA
jgi:hypothetical protein